MSVQICIVFVVSLIIGFLLGRWRPKDYCGDVIVTKDAASCTFALDIPREEIPLHHELVFRVVTREEDENTSFNTYAQ